MAQAPQVIQEKHDAALDRVTGMFGGGEPPELEKEPPQTPADAPGIEGDDQGKAAGDEPQKTEASEQGVTQAQSEDTEVVIDGETYLMPKKIADRFIHQADYTRKTQDLAELRRVSAAEREAIMLERAFEGQIAEERNQLAILDAQLSQYKKLDWSALDTEQLLKARAQLDQLKEQRAEIDTSIKAKRGQFDQKIQSVTSEVVTAGQKYIEQRIQKFSDVEKQALFAYGVNEGYAAEEMQKLIDPRLVVTLWKASKWDALQASKPGINKRAAQAAPTIRPGATQPQSSRIQKLSKAIKDAKTSQGKKVAAEEYFAHKMGR